MEKLLSLFFLLVFSFWNSQTAKINWSEPDLNKNIHLLDQLMKNNDERIITLLCSDVSFGHSNGWIQNLEDFKKDFRSGKVIYKNIEQIEISEAKRQKNFYSIRRKIKVSGTYKDQNFEMLLALLEIWRKEKSVWKLWSRQSVEIKP